jgi:prolyl-tRNA editing enzyme YbaK/EbsC (Cys-tRNA(Pro) deacylase)
MPAAPQGAFAAILSDVRGSVDVHNFLVERDVPHEVLPVAGRTRSAERLAALLELPLEEVGKVVVFEGTAGGVAAVIPAGSTADVERVRKATTRTDLEPASDDRAAELTGYLAESMPPVGLPGEFTVVLDRALARDSVLYFPGGEARAVLKIRGKDLARATHAKVARIAGAGSPSSP